MANLLKDMRISEISLVIDPASPGAVVLFTKQRDDIFKRDVSDEPRDDRGRWTQARDYVREHAQNLSNHAKALATAVVDNSAAVGSAVGGRFKAALRESVGHTVSAISTTRPNGAYPVRGGGVQFDFVHTLADNSQLNTSVQIRPEHLPAYDRIVVNPQNNQHTLVQTSASRQALAAVHTVLARRGGAAAVEPFGGSPSWLTYSRTDPIQVQVAAHAAAVSAANLATQQKAALDRAKGLFNSGSGGSYSSSSSSPALSTQSGGISGSGASGIPTHTPSAIPPDWSKEAARSQPAGWGRKDQATGAQVPIQGANARGAGGWAYYTPGGSFVPGGDPDQQNHIEHVQDWVKATGERGLQTAKLMTGTASSSGGKAFFTPEHLDYIPAGRGVTSDAQHNDQRNYVNRYNRERARLSAQTTSRVTEQAGVPHTPQALHEPALAVPTLTDVQQFMRDKGVTKVPTVQSEGESLRWNEAERRPPSVAKRLF